LSWIKHDPELAPGAWLLMVKVIGEKGLSQTRNEELVMANAHRTQVLLKKLVPSFRDAQLQGAQEI